MTSIYNRYAVGHLAVSSANHPPLLGHGHLAVSSANHPPLLGHGHLAVSSASHPPSLVGLKSFHDVKN